LYDDDAAVTTTDLGSDQATHQLDNARGAANAAAHTIDAPVRKGDQDRP